MQSFFDVFFFDGSLCYLMALLKHVLFFFSFRTVTGRDIYVFHPPSISFHFQVEMFDSGGLGVGTVVRKPRSPPKTLPKNIILDLKQCLGGIFNFFWSQNRVRRQCK